MNLLTKLVEKFKNIKDETKKRIVATVLAGGIALSGLGMTGCTSCNPDPNNTNPPIVTPGGDNGETQTPGGNNGGSQTPGSNSGGNTSGGNNSGSQTPDYSKYSQILKNVLTDPYYLDLESMEIADKKIGSGRYSFNNPKFMALPYGFLEDEGYDIEQIKKSNLYAKSEVYVKNNDLFIELRAETKTGTNFYKENSSYLTNYLIKYTLTDQEMKEVKALHQPLDPFSKKTYLQAPMFIQELSYLKTPEIISKAYITKAALDAVEAYCAGRNIVNGSHRITYLGTKQIDEIVYQPMYQTHIPTDSSNIPNETRVKVALNTIHFTTFGSGCVNYNSKQINVNTKVSSLDYTEENEKATEESYESITILSAYASVFENVRKSSIEEVLSK